MDRRLPRETEWVDEDGGNVSCCSLWVPLRGWSRRLLSRLRATIRPLRAVRAIAWEQLTPEQQQLLGPYRKHWDRLPAGQQEDLARGVTRWQNMTPEQRERAEATPQAMAATCHRTIVSACASAIPSSSSFSPDEQQRVREAFRRYRDMPPERREELRERWQEMTPEQREAFHQRWRTAPGGDQRRGRKKQGKKKDKGRKDKVEARTTSRPGGASLP